MRLYVVKIDATPDQTARVVGVSTRMEHAVDIAESIDNMVSGQRVVIECRQHKAGDKLVIELYPGGGWVEQI